MSDDQEDLVFDSHNGMSRVAMFWGVPVFPLLFCVIGFFLSGVIGLSVFGLVGILFPLPFVVIVLFIRILCERDDKALRRFLFIIRRWRRNKKYGRHLFITPRNEKWSKHNVQRHAKKSVLYGEK